MRYLTTIILSLLTLFVLTAATFLVLDGNLARLTGWYHFKKGEPIFHGSSAENLQKVDWMRIQDLHDRIECVREEDGNWWIVTPYRDRLSPTVAQAILAFTHQATLVDTLPLDRSTEGSLREFGVETVPNAITLKRSSGNGHTTVARYTLGAAAPWFADTQQDRTVIPTTYLRSNFYGDDERIHVVTGNILNVFENGLHALRDPHPLQIKRDSVSQIDISSPADKDAVSLARLSPQTPWRIRKPIITEAQSDEVEYLLDDLQKLKAIRVESKEDVELPDPAAATHVALHIHDEKPVILSIYPAVFSKRDDSMISYATVSDRDVVFTLPAAPRVLRKGSYANIINAVYHLPLLPDQSLAQLRSGDAPVYTSEMPLSLAKLRSYEISELPEKDIARFALKASYSPTPLLGILIPGDKESQVPDQWMYSIKKPYAQADNERIKNFLNALHLVPAKAIHDISKSEELASFGLDKPDYVLNILPLPCTYRSVIYGINMPLIKDRDPVSYVIKNHQLDGKDDAWYIHETGSSRVSELSDSVIKYLSLQDAAWRDKHLMQFAVSSVKVLTQDFQQAPLVLNYNYIGDVWTGTLAGKDITPRIRAPRAINYLRNLNKMRVDHWLPNQHANAAKALRQPAFRVKLDLEIPQIADTEAIVIDETDDADNITQDATYQGEVHVEDYLKKDNINKEMEDLLFGEQNVKKTTITLEIAPMYNSENTPFYGRIVETGEVFILSKENAWSLGNNLLEQ